MTPAERITEAVLVRPDGDVRAAVAARAATVIRPAGAFARLDELGIWLAGWQRRSEPEVTRPAAVVFAADHGVVAQGVSAYPSEVTRAMLSAVEDGMATCSALARLFGVDLRAIDVGVGEPTADLTMADAMTPADFSAAWNAGADTVADLAQTAGADLLILGELGIGNTTAAAAVTGAILGGEPSEWCGRGTGVDDEGLRRKQQAVANGIARLVPDAPPLEVLRCLGGKELVAIAGATVEARRRSIPMILDGFIATAAVLPLHSIDATALDHCVAGHMSAEPGHPAQLGHIGLPPILQLDLRLGEGTGALVALPIVRAAASAIVDVATFEEAAVPERDPCESPSHS